jgi:phosphopantothenoylcysteine decarboxylase/phosphopantothenate--cysteine ligase
MTRETLKGKQVVLAVTGSIAAVEVVKLAHALRRLGAEVRAVMSAAACGILHPDAVTYATGRPVITRISGMVEHVAFCGDGGSADLLLIAPCTGNTLAKIACGIDDTPVTTFATTAIGSNLPVIVVPAMHHSMYRHPATGHHIALLKEWGITVIGPRIEEGKAKIAKTGDIILHCERALLGRPLAGKRVLVTSGSCREPVDDVRVLTTRSSGEMGREIALQAFRLGAEVTVVHRDTFPCVRNVFSETAADMQDAVHRNLREIRADIFLSAAAISDFAPVRHTGKIRSGKPVMLSLEPLPKLIGEVLSRYHPVTVAFKLGWDEEAAAQEMLDRGAALVVMNTPSAMGAEEADVEILAQGSRTKVSGAKEDIAAAIWQEILKSVSTKGNR